MSKIGCAAYSFREPLQSGAMTLEQFVNTCAGLGLEGVELTSYYFPSTDRDYLNRLKLHCFRQGVEILATAVGSHFTHPDPEKRRRDVEMTLQWIQHSSVLGSPCLRVFAGPVAEGEEEETATLRAVECIRECVAAGRQAGVAIALENHGGVTATARQVTRILEAVPDPWFGLNLDFGNFVGPPYEQFREVAPRAISTHAKLIVHESGSSIELDYRRVKEIMNEASYRGFYSIEYEEPGDPHSGVRDFVKKLRQELG